jgi:hypothetical protein
MHKVFFGENITLLSTYCCKINLLKLYNGYFSIYKSFLSMLKCDTLNF